jgi:hypothetical protein
MPPLDYDNTKEPTSNRAEAGTYPFKVDEIEERRFNSGNKGLEATIIADVGGRDVTCRFVKFVYTDKALWKLKEFMESIGLDYHGKNEVRDFRGRMGIAEFGLNEKGYLEPRKFLPDEDAPHKQPQPAVARVPADDNVPF